MNAVARNHRLDLLRVIALMMIILMHSPMPKYALAPGYIITGLSYLTAPGIGLFFMISGALLLGNTLPTRDFLRRRISKILFPTVFWTVFYLIVNYIRGSIGIQEALQSIVSIPFSMQGQGILWFMYTLAGLYLLTPILSRWLKTASKREVEFYLFLWAITLLYPYLDMVLFIDTGSTGILYYFTGYLGYYLLGYYLDRYYNFRGIHVMVAIVISFLIPALLYASGTEFDFYSLLWYLSLPVVLMAGVWFVLINRTPNKRFSLISEISRLSFGIYFVHIFILRRILWRIDFIRDLPGLIQIPVVMVATFALSFLVVKLISRLPFSKYLIGV